MNSFEEEAQKIEGYAERLKNETREPGFLKKLTARIAIVWTLITRIPLPNGLIPEDFALPPADAIVMMPFVGGLLGFVVTFPAWCAALAIPPEVVAWIACGLYTILGWSLHLDGWGDLWDGIGSGKRGDAMRAVMKDSRIGAFGVAGIVLAIATRATLLSVISVDNWIYVCVAAGGVGRFASTVTAYLGKYPWAEGMGRDIVCGFKGYQLFCSFLVSCFLFPFAPLGWTIGMISASLAGAALALWANKNLGGTNGDVIGASAVLGELLVLIGCSI
jgi:adenosylcobinamide-GDP ribazoletransferase